MAKKRRTKKRKATFADMPVTQGQGTEEEEYQEQSPTLERQPSEIGDANAARSSVLSTEGKSSEGRFSSEMQSEEGTYTEMTSAVGSDEAVDANIGGVLRSQEDYDDDDDDVMSEGRSMYAAPSEYPTIAPKHRTEMPYGMDQDQDQDVDMLSTRSITEQDLDYRWEHGRRFCGPHYHMPNDDVEQIRLSLVHRIFLDIFDGKLTSAPLDDPDLILDVGTGIGEWAIGMSDQFPNCEVIGTDISAIQPTSVPTNCFFELDDAELEWTREPDSFDLVHFRNMLGSFTDWHFIYAEAFRAIKPGGWIELVDFDDSKGGMGEFVGQFPPESDIHEIFKGYTAAVEKSGRVRGLEHLNPSLLHQVGFVDIKVTEHIIPINIEAGGGKLWLISCIDGMEAMTLRLLTQHAGWEGDRVKEACYNVAREMAAFAKDPAKAKGLTITVRVVLARKPLDSRPGERSPKEPFDEADMAMEVIAHGEPPDTASETSPGTTPEQGEKAVAA